MTKSGTNRFSGSAYHFLRNDALNANSFFRNMNPRDRAVNSAPPRLRYNNFGYTLGGPALPGRKKLFFFFSQEWRRSTPRRKDERAWPVPDPAWLTDPASPNYVPPEARDPNAVRLLTLWPAPNVPGTNRLSDDDRERVRHSPGVRASGLQRQRELVVDRPLSARSSRLARRVSDTPDLCARPSLSRSATSPWWRRGAHGGGSCTNSRTSCRAIELSRERLVQQAGATSGSLIPELFPENAANLIPTVSVTGLSPLWSLPQPSPREYLNHTFSSALTLQHGTHTLKAGGLVRARTRELQSRPGNDPGLIRDFSPEAGSRHFRTSSAATRAAHAASVAAIPKQTSTSSTASGLAGTRRTCQDTWRIHPRVTLDLGLRYAFYPPLTDADDKLFTFSPDAYDPAQAPTFADPDGDFLVVGTGNLFNGIRVAGKDSPHGRAIYAADKNNLQPRIGAAWDPGGAGRLVLRAGYGMYFDQTQVGMFAQNVQGGFPFTTRFARIVFVSNAPLSNPGAGTLIEPPCAVFTPVALATSDRFVAPRWQHWNIGLQRRLYSRGMIDVGYVGSAGRSSASIREHQPARSPLISRARPAGEPRAAVPGLRRDLHARDDGQEPLSRAAWPAFATRLAVRDRPP